MSKILAATCSDGTVKFGDLEVEDVTLLCDGTGESTGILIIDEEKLYYVATNAADLKNVIIKTVSLLDNVHDALSQIATTLTNIGAGMTGATTAPPPTLGTAVSTINSKVTALDQVKTDLNSLKDGLA